MKFIRLLSNIYYLTTLETMSSIEALEDLFGKDVLSMFKSDELKEYFILLGYPVF